MTTVHHHVFLNVFGIYRQRLPLQSFFVEVEGNHTTGRVLRKGFVIDLENGDQLIFSDFAFQLVYGIRTPVHDFFPMQFLPVLNMNHLYSLLVQYGKKEVLCN